MSTTLTPGPWTPVSRFQYVDLYYLVVKVVSGKVEGSNTENVVRLNPFSRVPEGVRKEPKSRHELVEEGRVVRGVEVFRLWCQGRRERRSSTSVGSRTGVKD